jgi:hypothetical protein
MGNPENGPSYQHGAAASSGSPRFPRLFGVFPLLTAAQQLAK